MGTSPPPVDGIRAAVTPEALEAVRDRAPRDVEVVALQDGIDPSRIDFLVPPSDGSSDIMPHLPRLERLAVVQVLSAGTDWIEELLPRQATLCSARGARDAPVAEWILGALLGTTTGLLECARISTWTDRHLTDLAGWTVLVIGMGSIGRMVQARLEPLGTTVVGVASRARDDLHGDDELPQLLPQADAVVLLAPLTAATHGLIGAAELAAMRDGALLVNAARGPVVDTDALLAEMSTGRLRAVLDVTDPEPLPDGHPLWSAPGVLSITPHIAGDSAIGHARAAALAGEQLARWRAGEPLRNVVRAGAP
ncbi:MAG TPA: NAD(P)-dependent oxidoreductase [Solirubrobacteraceae bacterium]|nr:NAD(P)-dependent oxidoreductase [Solirubrobacteraceae bacterium]